MISFPLVHILFWIALALAPSGTSQITISSGHESWSWKQSPTGWIQASDSSAWSVSGKQVMKVSHAGSDSKDVNAFVEGIQGHDWSKEPMLKLRPMTSLESVQDGFIYTVNRGDPTAKAYHITFVGPGVRT